ncbi:MAG: glutamyl-tRNA reductase [Elusimicrobia bacterium]|nr:glutamyl-tRNA reductase [Elusimicrobiota bacterium]
MDLLCVGLNHRTAPVDVREKLCFSREELREALPALRSGAFSECVLVSTCNRTEAYAVSPSGEPRPERLRDFLVDFKGARQAARPGHFYALRSGEAAKHLFELASGLDSMVLGDVQILGQVKDAFSLAAELSTSGLLLNRLFQTAFHVGKRSRAETGIGEGAVSVSFAAAELAAKIFERLDQKRVLLIGAGETGELTGRHLAGRGVRDLLITNRTRGKAEEVAGKLGGTAVDFDALHTHLRRADIVISSVSAPDYVLRAEDVRRAMGERERDRGPLFLIDIGVPRNIDPLADEVGNVFLHDIDALQRIVDQNLDKRTREAAKVRTIVEEELAAFTRWHLSLAAGPTIRELTELFEEIRRSEVEKHAGRFGERDRELLDVVTRRVLGRILHAPITGLKNGGNGTDEETLAKISAVRTLFGLDRGGER